MYQLHIANKNYSSWSLRPWVLMTALEIPFTEQLTPFSAGAVQTAFKAFSPTAKVPCLADDKQVVWDSLAIIEYLAERHRGVWPEESAARTWARCASAEMHSSFTALRNQCAMSCGVRVVLPEISAALHAELARLDVLWTEGLTRFGGPFLAGNAFSAVDAFFAPVVFRIQTYNLPVSATVNSYCQHLLAQPAMQRWYTSALAETWREPAHEDEVTDNGKRVVVNDFRA
ncbi:glutathione S-transferase family protein [Candidatus Symbiopectobacterium sp. NZEC127]|uniref:glutathione S-transferase family protein n=1 Tax=Candidatus Symbiopectobacterium sp. NZEC127 TaxID=2820472 RepID=UPI0022271572|nr:glutathione S-transferase family protein [Candidatus Symbiopectobacterium sp. NZEC127]MCW2484505.1 glutathione S-transferase family protein [Candidatus Symbiopectobacterium sp. NZEC127]